MTATVLAGLPPVVRATVPDVYFMAASNYDAGSGPCSVAIGDFNNDYIADLAVANFGSNNVSILMWTDSPPPAPRQCNAGRSGGFPL